MAFHLDDDNYKIIRPIGKGGMSTVYLAKDKNLDRLVAIKLLHPAMSSDEKNRERLKLEALAIARINHENIVNVYSFVNKDENNYIVMEYIEGDTLSDFIDKNPINNPELILAIFLKILKGIGYTHQKNIIHRDIKPENIMISKDGKIKIMDFGIASIIGEVHNLTTTGSIMGSPMFMSPEHLTDEKIDKQSDIFSLGIILYWMLTKTYPFNGKNTAQLLNNILKCQFENPQKLNPLISNEIKTIIKKILQKSKLTRYKDSDVIIEEIETYFKNLNFDYKTELEIYFKAPNAYHKRFINNISEKYIQYANNLYKEKLISKSISYAYLALEYEPENIKAKELIKKIERGNIIKKYIPLALIIIIIISIIGYFLIFHIDETQNRVSQPGHVSQPINQSENTNAPAETKNIPSLPVDILEKEITKRIKMAGANSNVSSDNHSSDNRPDNNSTNIRHKTKEKNNHKNALLKGRKKRKVYKKIKKEDIEIATRISPKAATIYLDNKLYGYGNINKIKIKTNQKYKLKVISNGCYKHEQTLFYKDKKVKPLTIRLKWKSAKLKVINTQLGDIFINNNYKGNYKEYNYEIKPNPLSNGNEKLNLKIIKDGKIIFIKDIILKAGQTIVKKT